MRSISLAIAGGILLLMPALHIQPGNGAVLPVLDTRCIDDTCSRNTELSFINDLYRRAGGGRGGGKNGGHGSPDGSPGSPGSPSSPGSPLGEDGGFSGNNDGDDGMNDGFGESPKMSDGFGDSDVCPPGSTKRGCTGSKEDGDGAASPPGQGGENVAPPQRPEPPKFDDPDVEEARMEGIQRLRELDEVSGPDRGKKISVTQAYDRARNAMSGGFDLEAKAYLEKFPINTSPEGWMHSTVSNKPDEAGLFDILETLETWDGARKEGSTVMLSSHNRDRDYLRGERRMAWSDMVMDNWRTHCTLVGGDVAGLKYMARDTIITIKTRKTMVKAVEHVGGDKGAMNTFKYGAQGPERDGFDAIAGTVHGSRVAMMLRDHHEELKDMKIKAFHVFLPEHSPNKNRYDMVIEFGR